MIFRILIMNIAKQMEQATPRNKEHVEENWWERMGGYSRVEQL